MIRIAHLSDLHFGTEDPQVCNALHAVLHELNPDLVAVSGDLTQRARPSQFEAAQLFLASLPGRLLVVPGNHDVPLFNLPARMFWPYRNYERAFGEPQAAAVNADLVSLIGVDSTRRWRHKEGWLGRRGDRSIPSRLPRRALGSVLGMVTHHPLLRNTELAGLTPERGVRRTVQRLHRLGVDFVLCGHDHEARAHWFELAGTQDPASEPQVRSIHGILQISAGTATSRRVRGEPNSFNLLRLQFKQGARPAMVTERWNYQSEFQQFKLFDLQATPLSSRV